LAFEALDVVTNECLSIIDVWRPLLQIGELLLLLRTHTSLTSCSHWTLHFLNSENKTLYSIIGEFGAKLLPDMFFAYFKITTRIDWHGSAKI
jgi:hypothetical protein